MGFLSNVVGSIRKGILTIVGKSSSTDSLESMKDGIATAKELGGDIDSVFFIGTTPHYDGGSTVTVKTATKK